MSAAIQTELPRLRRGITERLRGSPFAGPVSHASADTDFVEQVMARCPGDRAPVILVFAPDGSSNAVAERLAVSSALMVGRTLLIEVGGGSGSWDLSGRIVAERDRTVPALHRADLGLGILERSLTEQPIAIELEAISRAYRMVVIVCAAAGAGVRALALAPLCTGTLLVVGAGRARLRDIDLTVRMIDDSGGRVLGLVLSDAPVRLPRWLRRS